ncbi:DNA-binding GntR family transcriptional regulator [Amycolatopsis lexingtonensis]|uniref:DNA-binding GntR family transcriptional regulator n=1 Tax=Amycolatopsis lexingtonensis TaxID=218822 RepID=A0ABR9I521_9PSEU|nr:GntR family transcriptional regulator [Amycolatopsis lexingtonensis]MBE1498313.1 DNA-binding GntR family transcriptional regulator [Amycolatopsis lexingtonensis]
MTGERRLEALPGRQVLADGVYEQIRALIMNDGIAPGARVNIDEIARELGVSGTPVREALARLESEELVSRLPLRGYRVTELLNRKEVDDMYALRLLLEPPSAALAAAAMSDENVALLDAELATCPPAPAEDAYKDYKALTAHDQRLHELILRLAGNVAVEQAFARTHCHLHFFRLNYNQPFGEQTITEHRAIVDALIAGNAVAARKAMTAHLEVARDRLLSRL